MSPLAQASAPHARVKAYGQSRINFPPEGA